MNPFSPNDDEDIFIPETDETSESYQEVNDPQLGNLILYSDVRVNAYNKLLQLRTYVANIDTYILHLQNRLMGLDINSRQIIASIEDEIDSLVCLRQKAARQIHDIEYNVFYTL